MYFSDILKYGMFMGFHWITILYMLNSLRLPLEGNNFKQNVSFLLTWKLFCMVNLVHAFLDILTIWVRFFVVYFGVFLCAFCVVCCVLCVCEIKVAFLMAVFKACEIFVLTRLNSLSWNDSCSCFLMEKLMRNWDNRLD